MASETVIVGEASQNVAVYVELEQKVGGAESIGVRARHEFGFELLKERIANGGNQLPHGRLDEVCDAAGITRREAQNRMQFAEEYPTEEKVRNALHTFGSWYGICSEGLGKRAHVSNNSGDNEWYTPPEYIEAARATMGGIDLDPASSDRANEIVRAATYYTIHNNGLDLPWTGRVWMNPPYSKDLIWRFTEKLADEYANGNVTEACVLVNNATETAAFQRMAELAAAMCFPAGRIKYLEPATLKPKETPLQGQTILYFGTNIPAFAASFINFGFVAYL